MFDLFTQSPWPTVISHTVLVLVNYFLYWKFYAKEELAKKLPLKYFLISLIVVPPAIVFVYTFGFTTAPVLPMSFYEIFSGFVVLHAIFILHFILRDIFVVGKSANIVEKKDPVKAKRVYKMIRYEFLEFTVLFLIIFLLTNKPFFLGGVVAGLIQYLKLRRRKI